MNHTFCDSFRVVGGVVVEVWIVLGLAQLALVALIAAGAFGWRWRVAANRVAQLGDEHEAVRIALEAGAKLLANAKPAQDWDDMLDERIAELDNPESEADQILLMALRYERHSEPINLTASATGDAEVEALKAELEALRAHAAADGTAMSSDRETSSRRWCSSSRTTVEKC
ncbi:MAG: hypothetical protein HC809_12365 [Gammaproteobacteria bacterium]|nr:hypothetical protein [Gammaproteobacteria bacterium]